MIENLQDELYQLEKKQAKGAKLHANILAELRTKNAPKLFPKYLKESHILMIINQSILAMLRKFFSNLRKNVYKILYIMKPTFQAVTTESLSKISNRNNI